MDIRQLFFSYKGRIGRLAYWLGSIGNLVISLLLNSIAQLLTVSMKTMDASAGASSKLSVAAFMLAMAVVMLVALGFSLWATFAVPAKRWHDRGKSAWWVLMGLIPIVGWIWTFVECGCLPGTPGSNRYGASTGGPAEVAATFS